MTTFTSERFSMVLKRIESFVASGEVRGAALAVARGGDQILEWQTGDAREGVRATAETLWPLASISKLYTAAVVMVLVEAGELSLSTSVRSVLPEFDHDGRELINLRHLLTHTSGLIYESPQMEDRLKEQQSIDDMVREAFTHPLMFQPGTKLSYADYNYLLAGRMAAQVTATAFPDLVKSLVLDPGGLRDTYMPPPQSEYPLLAYVDGPLAEGTEGAMYNSPYALDLAHPAFGTVSTASDLLRFGLLFAPQGKRRILSEAGVRVMTTDQSGGAMSVDTGFLGGGAPRPWGAGFMIKGQGGLGADLLSPSSFGHGGASGCALWVDPEADISIAFVSNTHASKSRPKFVERVSRTINGVLAELTRRD